MAAKENRRYFYLRNSKEVEEVVRCTANPLHFILTHVFITHPMKGKIGFRLFNFQMALLRQWLLHRYTITLKPRQMGISTLVCAYILWLAIFHPYKYIKLISIKDSVSKNMLRKVKMMYANLPDYLKMEVVNGSRDQYGTADLMIFANGSEIASSPATEDAGRSDALSCLVMDEIAFQRYSGTIWTSAQPTLSTGGQAILFSSAFGIGNFFYDTYMDAVTKHNPLNPFKALKLDWRMHPERDINWYNTQRAILGAKRCAQEIDCDFLQSGFTVFDMAKIKAIEDRLADQKCKEFENGRLKQYFEFTQGHKYWIGADVATGRSRDFSAFSIFDETGLEYACYKGKIGIREYGHLLMKWGRKYGNAVLAPESNAIGEGVISVIQEAYYPNLYNNVSKVLKMGEFEKDESMIYGWMTTGKSRHEIISGMDDDLDDDEITLNNPFFVNEAYTFVYSQNNKPIALGKELGKSTYNSMYEEAEVGPAYTDDSILAACIGNEVRKQRHKFRGAMPIAGGKSGGPLPMSGATRPVR